MASPKPREPRYKLIYFNARGRAEPIRQLFAVAGKAYEDFRVDGAKWPEYKNKTPFHQLPVLEVDGFQLGQSGTILRYVAKQFGYAGKDSWEQALVDAYADQWKDFLTEITPFIVVAGGRKEGDLEKLRNEVFLPAITKHLPLFVNALNKNSSGFLIGDSLSYVDIWVADLIGTFEDKFPEALGNFPELKDHRLKIHSIPAIKKWIETRPVTPF